MISLVATDLDGTLLDPAGRISDADAEAVRAASAAGVTIVVATGRPLRWLGCLDVIADAGPLVVASNGAAVFDLATRAVVRRHPLGRDTLEALADDLRRAIPGVLLAVEEGEVFGCEPGWASRVPDRSRSSADEASCTVRADWPGLLELVSPVVKLLALHRVLGVDALERAASEVVGTRAVVTHSVLPGDRALLEISAPGVSKASTLAGLCAERGVDPADVAAFGDMPNDLAMLEFAGHPFVMADAHPRLLARFPVIGSNADGGVGRKLRELLESGAAGSREPG